MIDGNKESVYFNSKIWSDMSVVVCQDNVSEWSDMSVVVCQDNVSEWSDMSVVESLLIDPIGTHTNDLLHTRQALE
jgi:hypothetical protein